MNNQVKVSEKDRRRQRWHKKKGRIFNKPHYRGDPSWVVESFPVDYFDESWDDWK